LGTSTISPSSELFQIEYLQARRRFAGAERKLVRVIGLLEMQNGQHHRLVLRGLAMLGQFCGTWPQSDTARTYFQVVKDRAGTLFGETPPDAEINVLIGYTHLHEGDYEASKRLCVEARNTSLNEPGFEMVFVSAMIGLLHLHVAQREFRKLFPLLKFFFKYFSFLQFLRINRVVVFVGTVILFWFIYTVVQGHMMAFVLILGTVVITGQLTLRWIRF